MTSLRTNAPRRVDPATLIRVDCSYACLPGYEVHHEPRRWSILTTREAIDNAEQSGRTALRVATYQPDGEKTTAMLGRLPPGLQEAWIKKHGRGLVHLNFIHNARTSDLYGCRCVQCTDPETVEA